MARAPDPPVQVRRLLAVSKLNARPFEEAWTEALRRALFPHDSHHRHAYMEALTATKEAFRAGYEGREVPGGPQLLGIVDALARPDQSSWVGANRRTDAA